jgi:hypothetical protein
VKHPEKADEARKMYAEIESIFQEQLVPKINDLIKFLEGHPMQLSDIPEEN